MKNYTNDKQEVYSYEDNTPKEFLDTKIEELGLISITDEDLAILRLPSLEDVRISKTNEINTACGNEIVNGFVSDALGTENSYKSGEMDQLNLIGVVAGGTDDYYKANGEYKMHTAEQLLQILNDGKTYKQTLLQKANTLKVQISTATLEELETIVW